MVLEIMSLQVQAGQEQAFESAFQHAQKRLAHDRAYITHELQRNVDEPGHYALLVEWQGTSHAARAHAWQQPLQPYLAAPPLSHHFQLIAGRGIPPPTQPLRYPD